MSLVELARLCPPPAHPIDAFADGREEDIKTRFGLTLPDEYIAFGHTYGTGGFEAEDTHEVIVRNPFSRHYYRKIEEDRDVIARFFRRSGPSEFLTVHGLHQEDIFPLGRDTDDAYLFWVVPMEPKPWQVMVIFFTRDRVELFDQALCSFLLEYFSGRLIVRGWLHRWVEGEKKRYMFKPPVG